MSEKNNKNILYCSFCGKSQHEVKKLIAGPTVFICDECVELCMDIIKEENKSSLIKHQEGVPTPREICKILDKKIRKNDSSQLIEFVDDRKGHDKRYSIDPKKLIKELNWKPSFKFDLALEKTIIWYIKNQKWCESVKLKANYFGERIG